MVGGDPRFGHSTGGPADRQLRVCLVTREEPCVSGTSRYVDCLVAGLRLRGHNAIHRPTHPTGVVAKVLDLVGGAAGLGLSTFLSAYPLRLDWPRADLYHLTAHTYASVLPLGAPPGPCVVTVHDIGRFLEWQESPARTLRSRAHSWAETFAVRRLRRADLLIADSEWTRGTLLDAAEIRPDRVTVVPLAVDHERFRPREVPTDFREAFDLPAGGRYVTYVGNDEPRKNLPTIFRALARVRERLPDVVLLKVGKGYDPAARARLVALAGELGIEGAVRYFDGVPEEVLPLFYNASVAMLMPSLYEGFGLPALEAMASGTPAILSHDGALREISGEDGAASVDPLDDAALAGAVVRLLEDPGWAAQVSERGIRRAREFTWDATIDQTLEVYRRAIQRRAARDGAPQ